MRKKILGIVAAATLFGSLTANAVPVGYNVTYTPTLGPSGTGAFVFDNDVGAITNFQWDFGGIIGNFGPFLLGTTPIFGDTTGRYVFEILSQTDVHSGINCLSPNQCSYSAPIFGAAPFGATNLRLLNNATGPGYQFRNAAGATLAAGSIAIARVPEPSALALLFLALGGLRLAVRTRQRQA